MSENTIEMDIRGQVCPSCLLFTMRVINQQYSALQQQRCRLVVLTDSRDATATIPKTVANMGLSAEIAKDEGYYRITVRGQRGAAE